MMTQVCTSTFSAPQELSTLRPQAGGNGDSGGPIILIAGSSEDDDEARAAAVRMAQLITMRHRIDFLLNVTEQCNVTLPSIHEQRGNVSPIILGEAGGATWAI